jgi:hypothetical protein
LFFEFFRENAFVNVQREKFFANRAADEEALESLFWKGFEFGGQQLGEQLIIAHELKKKFEREDLDGFQRFAGSLFRKNDNWEFMQVYLLARQKVQQLVFGRVGRDFENMRKMQRYKFDFNLEKKRIFVSDRADDGKRNFFVLRGRDFF